MLHSSSSRTSLSSLDDAQSLACGVPRSRLHVLAVLDVVDALLARYRPRPTILHPPPLLSFAESPALRFLLVDDERYRGDVRIALEEHFALRIDDRGACVVDESAYAVTRSARDELASARMRVSCVPGLDAGLGCLVGSLLPLRGAVSSAARGPTPATNWVVAQRVLCGAYPGAPHEPLHSATVDALMRAGVTTFVSLIESHEERIMPVPYAATVDEWLRAHPALRRPPARFLSLPTPDQDVASDASVVRLLRMLLQTLAPSGGGDSAPEVVFVHCMGGHGRTGVLVALLLAHVYALRSDEALQVTRVLHGARLEQADVPSPSTPSQVAQVHRLLATPLASTPTP